MIAILIVCTANICRSPMAEALMKRQVSGRPDADLWHIESAGTWAVDGRPPAFLSKYVMEMMGMDISNKKSQPVSQQLLGNFDLVLTMEEEHKQWLMQQYPGSSERIFMLSEMVGETIDIPDPIGGELFEYQQVAQMIEKMIAEGLERIYQTAIAIQRST
jgi:protein-tyrosine-phosphatase